LFSIGIDYGTNSVRAIIVNIEDGEEFGTAVSNYKHGEDGIVIDPKDPHCARQEPADYLESLERAVKGALREAERRKDFNKEKIVGIGLDATASTPIPVSQEMKPLSYYEEFRGNLNAMAWLWKDHTSSSEAEEITELAAGEYSDWLARCGGKYSSEWYFAKILHCYRTDRRVFDAAYTWLELSDYIPAVLCNIENAAEVKRNVCAAGHKAMFAEDLGGFPPESFFEKLEPDMVRVRKSLPSTVYPSSVSAGKLGREWAERLELSEGLPVAVGSIDAHLGAVGAGVAPGVLVKVLGTSSCDMMVQKDEVPIPVIKGVAGVVHNSILPGYYGIEAGQSAVGDIFRWFSNIVLGGDDSTQAELTKKAKRLKPGESGLLALDWNNGNRNIIGDDRLTGLLIGQTLRTKPEEIYRALIEATAFGALKIIERLEEYGVKIEKIINCGGIAEKNPMLMQIYADVTGRSMLIARSSQAAALGAAIFGSVAAGSSGGGWSSVGVAQEKMCGVKPVHYEPDMGTREIYGELYQLYSELHDSFGRKGTKIELFHVMKKLLELKKVANR